MLLLSDSVFQPLSFNTLPCSPWDRHHGPENLHWGCVLGLERARQGHCAAEQVRELPGGRALGPYVRTLH